MKDTDKATALHLIRIIKAAQRPLKYQEAFKSYGFIKGLLIPTSRLQTKQYIA